MDMTAEIIQFVPKPNPHREERLRELERQGLELVNAAFPQVNDPDRYHAPEKDPA